MLFFVLTDSLELGRRYLSSVATFSHDSISAFAVAIFETNKLTPQIFGPGSAIDCDKLKGFATTPRDVEQVHKSQRGCPGSSESAEDGSSNDPMKMMEYLQQPFGVYSLS